VKTTMAGMGYAVMGTASASGAKRTIEAAQKAIASPLLEAGAIDGARGILINITGSSSLKLAEVQQACTIIQGAAHEDANIIFGAVMDEKMKDAVKITVIATGFREAPSSRHHKTANAFSTPSLNDPDFSDSPRMPEAPAHIMSESMEADSRSDDHSYDDVPVSAPLASEHVAEVVSLDSMRNGVLTTMSSNFEPDDLDVPAFLRKRNEVM
jgi:cell division protein FtsZ